MLEVIGSNLLAFEKKDRLICQKAAEASSETKPLLPLSHAEPFFTVDSMWTPRVLRGLARISLQQEDFDYSGLSQAEADYIIGELSGSVDDFIYEILSNANG